jgi:hypothetical protein
LRIKLFPKFKERQRKEEQRANQTPDKIQERRAADLRNKARARANETPEQGHERRAANLRNKARARANESPEQAHERRVANLINKARASGYPLWYHTRGSHGTTYGTNSYW